MGKRILLGKLRGIVASFDVSNQPDPPTVTSSAREIFLRALDANDPASQKTLLDSACGENQAMRREVESMLEESSSVGDFLESPAIVGLREPPKVGLPAAVVRESSGDMIGSFQLGDLLGEGGCGMVYAAEQHVPVRRTVALKIIKLGMDTNSVIARFESERQALAIMDHPNIAKVLDAGATDTGRPYFVMELVRGVAITEFCDEQKLSTPARLELFMQVCLAIQHAHQKGIIHRDIKPSNILVAAGDDGPNPKVIDFGIAKATEQRLTERTLFTAVESFIGTPTYMSPEQAEVGGIDIDTRSDIYALGVLLYELLVGHTPFEASELQQLPLDEMRRTIRESEPERPSLKFGKLPNFEQQKIADCHECEPGKLSGLLRGDLDWIVMKCLEKDRKRRYASASDLVADIERHLQSKPVYARPPSKIYRLKKLFRRHGAAIATGVMLFLTMLAGIALSTTQAIRATHAERESREGREVQEKLRLKAEQGELRAMQSAAAADLNEYVADINLTQLALSEGNFGRARQLIDKHIPEPGEIDHCGFEWRYLSKLGLGDAHVALPNQGSLVQALAYSSDGRLLAVGLRNEIRIWDVATRTLVTSLPGGADSLLFLNDGKTLVSSDRGTTWVVDTSSWFEIAELRGSSGPLVLSPDGSQLATSSSEGIRIWDTADWFEVQRFPDALPGPIKFSPDGKILAGLSKMGIALWSLQGQRLLHVLEDSEGVNDADSAGTLAFSLDGRHLIAPRNTESAWGIFVLGVWDVETGEEIEAMRGHTGAVVAASGGAPFNLLVSASLDHSVGLWDLATNEKLALLNGHRSEVWSVALSPNGRTVASGSKDGDVRIWSTSVEREADIIPGEFTPIGFSSDSQNLAVLGKDNSIRMLALPTLELSEPSPASSPVSFGADLKTMALAREDGSVEIVTPGGGQKQTIRVAQKRVNFLRICPRGDTLLTQSGLQPMYLWDLRDPKSPVMSLRAESAYVSADGSMLAGFGIGNLVGIWDLDARRRIHQFSVERTSGSSGAISTDGKLLAVSGGLSDSDNQVSLWETASGKMIGSLSGHKQSVRSLAFTPDGLTLATASEDGTIKLWNVATRQELLSIRRPGSSLRHLMFSPDGQWLVGNSASDGELRIFHAPNPT